MQLISWQSVKVFVDCIRGGNSPFPTEEKLPLAYCLHHPEAYENYNNNNCNIAQCARCPESRKREHAVWSFMAVVTEVQWTRLSDSVEVRLQFVILAVKTWRDFLHVQHTTWHHKTAVIEAERSPQAVVLI